MAGFLVEFRLQGYAKKYARWARTRVRREAIRLGIRELRQPRFVPHITLFGGARTSSLRRVITKVERIGRKYTLVPFKLGVKRGEFQKEDAYWLYLEVHPSPDLEQFRWELAQNLCRLETRISDTCQSHDRKPKYKFHCSIGKYNPGDSGKFEKLSDYAEAKCSLEAFKQHKASVFSRFFNIIKKNIFIVQEDDPGINLHLLRVTVLGRKNRIHGEYDLVLGRLLSRRQALSRYWRRRSIEVLKNIARTQHGGKK